MYDADSLLTSAAHGDARRWLGALREHGADQPEQIAAFYFDLAQDCGINADLALAQACLETAWFTSDRWRRQRNAAGIGITSDDVPGPNFQTVERGIRAHYAHLCCYVYTRETCPIRHDWSSPVDQDRLPWWEPRHGFHKGDRALATLKTGVH